MKALRHSRFGPPSEVLELVDETLPALRDRQAAVRTEAAPIHFGDLKNIAGEKIMVRNPVSGGELKTELPQVPGIEAVGRITGIGAKVTDFRLGDRVFLLRQNGSWREEAHADVATLFPAPEGDPVQLSLIVNAYSADLALRDLHPLSPGDWFLQNAANSNVGRVLIALARLRGIRTVNIVRRAALVEELKALGADVVLVDGPDLPARVREATRGAALKIGLDGIAGAATGRLAECLSDGGTVANMGLMSAEPCSIPSWILLYRRVTVRGYFAGFHLDARTMPERRKILWDLGELIRDGVISCPIAATYPLSDFRKAVTHAAKSGSDREGKIVFTMDA